MVGHFHANKAHGHDYVSMGLLNVADIAVVKLLSLIIKICIQYEIFPNQQKKSSIVSIHKKVKKHRMVNYRPVSILPISWQTV